MTTPLTTPALTASKMRRILGRSVTFRVSSQDTRVLASHKLRKPKLIPDQKSWTKTFKQPPPSATGFPSLNLTKQSSAFTRDAFQIYKKERDSQFSTVGRAQLDCRLSLKLPKQDTRGFLNIDRMSPFQEACVKARVTKKQRLEKQSDILDLTPTTRCSDGSDTRSSIQSFQSETKIRSHSLVKRPTFQRTRWFGKTKRGQKPMSGATANQDAYFVKQDLGGLSGLNFLGVCDGHGSAGHLVSKYVSFSLANFFTALLKDYLGENRFVKSVRSETCLGSLLERFTSLIQDEESTDMEQLLKMAFVQTNRALAKEAFDTYKSGTSACTVLVAQSTLFCANAGDSRAVLGKKDGMFWRAAPLSRDHKPTEMDERSRIVANNGRVLRLSGGSLRIWMQEKMEPGLALSRTLGDKMAHKVGVISTPEVKRHQLREEDKFVIVGSDGLWDKVPSQEAVNLVGDYLQTGKESMAASALVSMATQRWKQEGPNEETYYMDDITAVVTFLP